MIGSVVEDDNPGSAHAIVERDLGSTCAIVEHDLGSPRAVFLGREQKYGETVKQRLDEDKASDALDPTFDVDEVMRDIDAFNATVENWLL